MSRVTDFQRAQIEFVKLLVMLRDEWAERTPGAYRKGKRTKWRKRAQAWIRRQKS